MQHGHAACPCSIKHSIDTNMQHGHALGNEARTWTCSIDKQQGYVPWTSKMYMQNKTQHGHGNAALTSAATAAPSQLVLRRRRYRLPDQMSSFHRFKLRQGAK
jgi:hypothetical protein